jgi:hypothetical protein
MILLLLTTIAAWRLVVGGTMIGQDTAAFFYPMFVAMGRRLAAGDLPGWNPHQFSGVPFAADPESGWMYLPAMLLFTILPVSAAAKLWLLSHLLLAGLGTYALGRLLRLGPIAALGAAVTFEFSGLLYARTVCCPAYSQVAAWLPIVLLTAEMALRSRGWPSRAGWWAATGAALSQIFVAWLGQGAYYALMAFAGYAAYRSLIDPARRYRHLPGRLLALVSHLVVPTTVGLGLAASAILPRLAYQSRTNLASGYSGDLAWAANLGGWDPETTVGQLLGRSFYYAGGAALVLAVAALLLARGRHASPFFALLGSVCIVLAQTTTTWLHVPFYALLPRFQELHQHWPERDMVIFYLAPALLAGAAIHVAGNPRTRATSLSVAAFVPLLLALILDHWVGPVDAVPLRAVFAASSTLLLTAHVPISARKAFASILVLLIFIDLWGVGRYNVNHGLYGGIYQVDLARYYSRSPVVDALEPRHGTDGQPARFFGYDPGLLPNHGTPPLYRYLFANPETAALLVNNRAELFGLEDIQGYNPIQPQRYVAFMRAMNGFAQEYHEANVYSAGLASPLLDLLNARYILIPPTTPPNRPDLQRLAERDPTIYADAQVRVLENREALPRVWIVHQARQVRPNDALSLLASGSVDPREVALLETPLPVLKTPRAATDRVEVLPSDPDHVRVTARTDAAGLLMLSETADPDWRATIDGKAVPILTADYLLRAVPVPAGEHTVVLHYDSTTLRWGTVVTVLCALGVMSAWIAAGWRRWRMIKR